MSAFDGGSILSEITAVILAAGLGSRLGGRTTDLPKALVPVNGRPILEYQFRALSTCGIRKVGVVVGHASQAIRDFVRSWRSEGIHIDLVENPEYATSNSAHSFWHAGPWITGRSYIHLNCDVMFSSDLLGRLMDSPFASAVVLDRTVKLGPGMELVALDGDRIVRMDNKPYEGAEAKAIGIARFGPDESAWMLRRAEEYRMAGDLNRNCFGLIREALPDVPFYGVEAGNDWVFEVNTPDDLARAEAALLQMGIV